MGLESNIPKGYKQTELGIIPEDWEVRSFSQIFDMFPNNTFPRDCMNNSHGEVRNIHYGDVLIKYPTIIDAAKCQMPYLNEDVKIKSHKVVQSGDVIIADTAEDDAVGKCVEVKNVSHEQIVAGLHTFFCHPVVPFASGWLGYYINSSNYHNQLIPYITGIKVSSISRASIQETKLLVPPIAEQRAIAEALSDVDGLIAALDKKIAKKRLLKQGAMQQLLTGKKRLPGFTDEWMQIRLEDFYNIVAGGDLDLNSYSPYKTKECKYPIYSNSLDNRGLYGYTSNPKYGENSITITGRGSLGHAEYRTTRFDAIVRLIVMKPLYNNICGLYITELINCISPFVFESTGVPQLTSPQVGATTLKIPKSLAEQQTIATILSDMDKEIADLEAQRDKYRLLKSGMMQKLLTGQIRLKNE